MSLSTNPISVTVKQEPPRTKRERATVCAMIKIYCQDHHDFDSGLCNRCLELKNYAICRLKNCRYQENKPTCGNCPVHCYKPSRRNEIIKVMRYSGPRMVFQHPYLALRHLLDGKRTVKKLSDPDSGQSLHQGDSKP